MKNMQYIIPAYTNVIHYFCVFNWQGTKQNRNKNIWITKLNMKKALERSKGMSLKTRLPVNFGAELPNALLGRYCNEKCHVLWLKFWGLISMTNILWLWWSQHLNPELSNVLVRGIYELQQHKAAGLHEMKELPGDTGSVSKGQVWLCHHADWLTYTAWLWLHLCGHLLQKKVGIAPWLPIQCSGCPPLAGLTVPYQKQKSFPPQPWWKSHCSTSQSAEQFLLSLTSSLRKRCRIRALRSYVAHLSV